MQITFPEPKVGALVTDVDLNTISDADFRRLYDVWLDRHVIAVRGQSFTKPQFLAASARFGRLKPHRVRRTRDPAFPEITLMGVGGSKTAGGAAAAILTRGQAWHTDSPWDAEVCKATALYGIAIPSFGGDTLFASMTTAYDALPDALKARIDGLSIEFAYGGRDRAGIELLEPEDQVRPPAVHPLVHRHRETGRRSLYTNPTHALRIVGLPEAESDRLLQVLHWYMLQPGAEYRHKWAVGDFVIWDNRSSVHCAAGGCPVDEARHHWRTTVMQDPPDDARAAA